MTATLAEQRHIILPPEIEEKTLLEHLRGMRGLELERRRESIPNPIEL